MTSSAAPAKRETILDKLSGIHPQERAALALSFAFFFCVLCSYYIMRPLGDSMSVKLGKDFVELSFSIVFLVMLAAVPVFGWIVTHVPRARIVPLVYGFVIGVLCVFWFLFDRFEGSAVLAGAFFVWVKVYILFVVSLFWSFMSDIWHTAQAKRLYGFVSVGGTVGALCGPLIVQLLLARIGIDNLLLVSALFLGLALAASLALRSLTDPERRAAMQAPADREDKPSIFAGAINVWKSPYLFRIAIWILIANVLSMIFYIEQARIVGAAITTDAERVLLFSRMETAVSIVTIALEIFVTGKLMQKLGTGFAIAIVPAGTVLALAALAIAPVLTTIVVIMVLSRAMGYGLSGPAMRVLWTVVDPADKYRAQNFIDTLVQRGGNAAAGWLFRGLGQALGAAGPVIAAAGIPVAIYWVWLSRDLGRRQEKRAGELGEDKTAAMH
ncbi:MAG: NTP/NDP exchange transporter [Beijerinckiaceae bacterium]